MFSDGNVVLEDESEVLGLRTIGFGRTVRHERFTAEPQRSGLSDREEGGMVLKKFPAGRSPEKRLWDMLKEWRWGRSASCFGRLPLSILKERSTTSRLVRLAIVDGTGPVRLLCDRTLNEAIQTKNHESKLNHQNKQCK